MFRVAVIACVVLFNLFSNVNADQTVYTYRGDTPLIEDGWCLGMDIWDEEFSQVENGVLHLDTNPQNITYRHADYYVREWNLPSVYTSVVVEFYMKLIPYSAFWMCLGNGVHDMDFFIDYDNSLQITYQDLNNETVYGEPLSIENFNPTEQFNIYKMILNNGTAQFYINDTLLISYEIPGQSNVLNGIEFGSKNPSGGYCEAYIDDINAYVTIEESDSNECAILEDDLGIKIPCIDVFGTTMPISLQKFTNSMDPFGYYWKLNLQ